MARYHVDAMSAPAQALQVDVVSDVVCPWCFVGKRRLEAALARLPAGEGEPPTVRWHPFELNPDLPAAGIDRATYVARKFGGAERADAIYARVRAAGETAGIAFRFDRIARQPNTRDAHRLVAWAQAQGVAASPLMERLFAAYFIAGRSLGGSAALAEIAAEAGLDAQAARTFLDSGEGTDEVVEAERRAHAIGVTGVPFFIFDRRVAVSGAQPEDVLLEAIARAREPATSDPGAP
jgi:predicted DsbA family dithiol-disulfide isomerase